MNSEDQTFLSLLAHVYLQNGRPEKAVVILAALDCLEPQQPQVLRALALAQVRSGKPQRALESLDRLAMIGQIDAVFHLLRAQALGLLERRVEAASAMQVYVQMRQALEPPTVA